MAYITIHYIILYILYYIILYPLYGTHLDFIYVGFLHDRFPDYSVFQLFYFTHNIGITMTVIPM